MCQNISYICSSAFCGALLVHVSDVQTQAVGKNDPSAVPSIPQFKSTKK